MVFAHFTDNLNLQCVCKTMVEPLRLFHPTFTIRPVGWNKRSGSTKRERETLRVRSAIDIHLDPPFAGEELLHEGFFF
ncbi:MAG: hypothetical protein L3J84_11115, partial [Gammaproteobacteria bacterium]|nr:hypothetical protein [Gammaproteobacteria bacterium]